MLNELLKKIDKMFCIYLGIDKDAFVKAESVSVQNNQIIVAITEPFKRHLVQKSWSQFEQNDLNQLQNINREKLGLAVGNALASDLVIHFG